ncbi:MAG: PAS domain S-box protein, partial [Planctomycetota bacterium]
MSKPSQLESSRTLGGRQLAENGAGEQRGSLQVLANACADRMMLLNADGVILFLNDAAAEELGRPVEELVGKTITQVSPPALAASRKAQLDEVVGLGQPAHFVDTWQDRILDHRLSPVLSSRGKVKQVAAITRDVTDWAQAETALHEMLHESQRREAEVSALLSGSRAVLEYREFQEAASSIFQSCKSLIGAASGYVALSNSDGTENDVVFLDSGGLECTVDPSLPMPIRGLREEAYRSGEALYDNDFCRSRWTQYLPTGHTTLESVLFAPLKVGQDVVGLLGLSNKPGGFTDHDAKMASAFGELAAIALLNSRTLESLENSEERFRSVTQSANDGMVSTDSSGKIVFWNEAAARMFGCTAEEVIGEPLTRLMPEPYRAAHRQGLDRACREEGSTVAGKTVEVMGLRSDGSEFPIELSMAGWRSSQGAFFTGILRDITDRKEAEEEIAKLARFPGENPNPVLRVADDGAVLYANKASAPLLDVWQCGEGGRLSGSWRRVVLDALRTARNYETELECGDRVFSLTFAPVAGSRYVNVYALDITDRKHAAWALQASQRELAIRDRIAKSFLTVSDEN